MPDDHDEIGLATVLDWRDTIRLDGSATGRCRHTRIVVDPPRRKVTCSACGGVVDPFDFLVLLAIRSDRLRTQERWWQVSERNARLALEWLAEVGGVVRVRPVATRGRVTVVCDAHSKPYTASCGSPRECLAEQVASAVEGLRNRLCRNGLVPVVSGAVNDDEGRG